MKHTFSDGISGMGCVFTLLIALAHLIQTALLALPLAILAMGAVWLIFVCFSLVVWRSRLPALWLIAAVGEYIFHSCSYLSGWGGNFYALIAACVALAAGIAGTAVQIVKRIKPRLPIVPLTSFLLVGALFGLVWGAGVGHSALKSGPAEHEILAVPRCYEAVCAQEGTVRKFSYQTKAYATDGRTVSKEAYLYLPYGYTKEREYDILYLLHGTGDGADYWMGRHPENKRIVDNLIARGDIRPLLIVMPTWYVGNDCADDPDRLTYSFRQEIRNDLMPAVEGAYSTYAASPTEEEFRASRSHRAFAGLSRGSITMFHSVMTGCLDFFASFGAFSGCKTTEEEFAEMGSEKFASYPIDLFYNTSGSFDFLLAEHLTAVRALTAREDRLTWGENTFFDLYPMVYHEAPSWHLALYNFLQHVFR